MQTKASPLLERNFAGVAVAHGTLVRRAFFDLRADDTLDNLRLRARRTAPVEQPPRRGEPTPTPPDAKPPCTLQAYLLEHYEDLMRRLTLRVGCAELAADSLQDIWLRLAEKGCASQVVNVDAYMFRMLFNRARDLARNERLHQAGSTDDVILQDVADSSPGPAAIAQARSDVRIVIQSIEKMPRRGQAIFIGVRVENLSHQEVATRHGVSVRMVAKIIRDTAQFSPFAPVPA